MFFVLNGIPDLASKKQIQILHRQVDSPRVRLILVLENWMGGDRRYLPLLQVYYVPKIMSGDWPVSRALRFVRCDYMKMISRIKISNYQDLQFSKYCWMINQAILDWLWYIHIWSAAIVTIRVYQNRETKIKIWINFPKISTPSIFSIIFESIWSFVKLVNCHRFSIFKIFSESSRNCLTVLYGIPSCFAGT